VGVAARAAAQGEGFDDKVVNASISGDTSAGGQARLPALLAEHKPELVILELGGNDGLRGMPPTQLQQNLASMIDSSRQTGAKVLLLGMQLPPNYGKRYTDAFAEVYGKLADEKTSRWCRFSSKAWAGIRADAGRWHAPGGRGPGQVAGKCLADAKTAAVTLF
jgi:lysophospholipase L1-like esterase